MNKPQLTKALAAAKIEPIEINGAGRTLEVVLANDKDMRAFQRKVAKWGGFGTQWGGWVLSAQRQADKGDFNDRTSRYHY